MNLDLAMNRVTVTEHVQFVYIYVYSAGRGRE